MGGLGVTVAIPVLNGMAHLPELLDALRRQEYVGELEILVFDSTSDDGSWEWLSARSDIVTRQIPRQGFSHGRTRQQMVEQASHGYVAFLTQDAVPASRLWLAELIRPFGLSDQVAAVVGLQTPRPDAPAVVKRDIVVSFANLGNPLGISIYQNGPTVDAVYGRQPLAFISDVNAAYRRDILMGPVPFPPVDYAEDQAIARELLDAGYAIAYSPFAEVIHSNDLDLGNFKERIVGRDRRSAVNGSALSRCGGAGGRAGDWHQGLSQRDQVFARFREPNRPFRARVKAAVAVPAFELRRRQAWRITRGARGLTLNLFALRRSRTKPQRGRSSCLCSAGWGPRRSGCGPPHHWIGVAAAVFLVDMVVLVRRALTSDVSLWDEGYHLSYLEYAQAWQVPRAGDEMSDWAKELYTCNPVPPFGGVSTIPCGGDGPDGLYPDNGRNSAAGWPPIYYFVVANLMRPVQALGVEPVTSGRLVSAAIWAAGAALLAVLVLSQASSKTLAVSAGVIVGLIPTTWGMSGFVTPHSTALLVGAANVALLLLVWRRPVTWKWAALGGVVLGLLSTLTLPHAIVVVGMVAFAGLTLAMRDATKRVALIAYFHTAGRQRALGLSRVGEDPTGEGGRGPSQSTEFPRMKGSGQRFAMIGTTSGRAVWKGSGRLVQLTSEASSKPRIGSGPRF